MGAFEALGVADAEERAYRWLLSHPRAHAREVARALRRRDGDALLARLADRGLVTSSEEGFSAVPPEVAVEHLILQQQEAMEAARAAATRMALEERALVEGGEAASVEVVRGPRARQHAFLALQRGARSLVRIVDRPPYAVAPSPPSNEIERERLREGVRYRVIYDPEGLSTQRIETLHAFTALGEVARVLPDLPVKLALADEQEALVVPLDETADAVVVRAQVLVASVSSLFEHLWERAMPLRAAGASEGRPDARDRQILGRLALGQKDEAIARDLGVARRTIERRVSALMRETGGRNRFQLGLEVERRGWLAATDDARA